MKNFSMENLTELSHNEMVNIQGGGLVDDYIKKLVDLANEGINLAKLAAEATGTFLKSLLEILF